MQLDPQTIEHLERITKMIQPPPIQADRDSFASFRKGLADNWVFVLAVVAVISFGFNKLSDIDSTNTDQDRRITTNAQDISALTNTVADYAKQTDNRLDTSNNNYNDITRRLDSIAKDIEVIKSSK